VPKWPEENKFSVKPSKYDLTRYESPSISAVRASNRYTEGLEFDFCWDSDFFSLSHACFGIAKPSSMRDECRLGHSK